MFTRKWDELPKTMKNQKVQVYYDLLSQKRKDIFFKRVFDLIIAFISIIILSPIFLIVGLLIFLDSKGPVIFCQKRVTQYGKIFTIFKFRSMVGNAESLGSQITGKNDNRITKVGKFLRKYRLDEIPQLFNILTGDMTFVGTRPEVAKYVDKYTDEMMATLLLPAGVTSEASIQYKDEASLLATSRNVDEVYIKTILPQKMNINLKSIREFSFYRDVMTIIYTIKTIFWN